jgi:cell division protein FtsI/penicillin-binding protein 2
LDATIESLSQIIDIQSRDKRRFKRLREESKGFDSLPIRTRLTDTEVARFAAQRYRFPGVDIKARLFRQYPYGDLASHVIGYIGRISPSEKERIEDDDEQGNYRGTDYIGKIGVEQSYEKQLHGITGVEQVETSAGGRAVRRLASSPATPGDTVRLATWGRLQVATWGWLLGQVEEAHGLYWRQLAPALASAVVHAASAEASGAAIEDARAAAPLMAMNNVFYRFRHVIETPVNRSFARCVRSVLSSRIVW